MPRGGFTIPGPGFHRVACGSVGVSLRAGWTADDSICQAAQNLTPEKQKDRLRLLPQSGPLLVL